MKIEPMRNPNHNFSFTFHFFDFSFLGRALRLCVQLIKPAQIKHAPNACVVRMLVVRHTGGFKAETRPGR